MEVVRIEKNQQDYPDVTLIFVLVLSQFAYQPGEAKAESDLGLKAEASIIIDGETGQIIYENNADKVLGIASMSKMMTEYIVLEAIKNKKITWDQKVNINEYVHNLSKVPNLSNVGLTQGEDYTVKELYECDGCLFRKCSNCSIGRINFWN